MVTPLSKPQGKSFSVQNFKNLKKFVHYSPKVQNLKKIVHYNHSKKHYKNINLDSINLSMINYFIYKCSIPLS